jgi:hypothetical protein
MMTTLWEEQAHLMFYVSYYRRDIVRVVRELSKVPLD